jgi:hypothetical protein
MSPRLPQECASDPESRLWIELRRRPEILDAVAASAGPELAVQARLRKLYPDELVRLAVTLHQLRQQGAEKFTRAPRMWFDRVGLEQATSEAVARHKARRFPAASEVWDLCCGIGSDALALASHSQVAAVDLRPTACLQTVWNAEAYEVADRINVRRSDVTTMPLPSGLVHLDPDRRGRNGPRAQRLEHYVPGLDFLHRLIAASAGGAIKVGPASNFGGKFPGAEIELISLRGECKEATVWFGSLAGPQPFRATVLPGGESLAGHPLSAEVPVTPLTAYLYDPDPAVVRAGLVDVCAERLGLTRLDAAEEYLTGETLMTSPFVTAFRVIAEFPNNERELRRYLRATPFGAYEIKCRHIPAAADVLRRRLPTAGHETATVFVARLAGQARLILTQRV